MKPAMKPARKRMPLVLHPRQRMLLRRANLALAALLAGLLAWALLAWPRAEQIASRSPQAWAATPDNIARGAYLARAGNCMGCHTARGGAAYAGGRALDTPFGRLVSPNITPDRATGIGTWSADDFWNALHNGIGRDGRLLYPAFPYTSTTRVTRDDADALFAFLASLPPVRQPNRRHALRFPYDQQFSLAAWRLLYFRPGVYAPDPARSAEWNRGAYLVRGLGHCGECHSPRNALGASGAALSGAIMATGGWYAPALAPDLDGGASAGAADLAQLLGTGVAARGAVFGPMADVVAQSLQYLTRDDLGAMASYLAALPPAARADAGAATASVAAPSEETMKMGARLYERHCADCHGKDGRGKDAYGTAAGGAPAYPPLAGSATLALADPVNAIRIVLNGGFPPSTTGNPRPFGMPPASPILDDAEVAAVVTYVRSSWGNGGNDAAGRRVTPPEVNRWRAVPLD